MLPNSSVYTAHGFKCGDDGHDEHLPGHLVYLIPCHSGEPGPDGGCLPLLFALPPPCGTLLPEPGLLPFQQTSLTPPPHTHTICSLPTMCISLHISVRAFEPGLLRRWFPAAPDACCLFFPSPCSLRVQRAGLRAGSITLCPWYLFSVQKYWERCLFMYHYKYCNLQEKTNPAPRTETGGSQGQGQPKWHRETQYI